MKKSTGGSGGGHIVNPDSGGGMVPEEDRTPPPAPENLSADGGMTAIYVTWDDPGLDYNYRVEIHRSAVDDVSTAVLHGSGIGTIYQDVVGSDKTLYYYWARFVKQLSTDIIIGPWNQTAGTPGQAGEDSAWVLDQISGKFDTEDLKTQVFTVDLFGVKGTDPSVERMAFAIDTTTTPPRVAMDGAYIIDATIGDAKIENLTVDKLIGGTADFVEANIRDGSITNAKIGNVIQSDNYQSDSDGWMISKNGYAEFGGAYFRGTIEGSTIIGGEITGSKVNGGTVTGSTIIGSTIYSSDQILLADPWGDGRVVYYNLEPEIPLSVTDDYQENITYYVNASTTRLIASTPVSAGYKHGIISNIRFRWEVINSDNLYFSIVNLYHTEIDIKVRALIIDPVTKEIRYATSIINMILNSKYGRTEYATLQGMIVKFQGSYGNTGAITLKEDMDHRFGHPSNKLLNGQFAIEIMPVGYANINVIAKSKYDNTVKL